jgi:citrate lyase beta subunit
MATRRIADPKAELRRANAALAKACPGDPGGRQPVHTYYTGAQFFRANMARELGDVALTTLQDNAPDPATLAAALGWTPTGTDWTALIQTLRMRVVDKLKREPVEDLRIDFEDGYGNRPDSEEDGHARSVAAEVAIGAASGSLPSFIGIRIKPLSNELQARSRRTLELFVSSLAHAARHLPAETRDKALELYITIPKVMMPGHVKAVALTCDQLERKLSLKRGSLKLELMIETPQSVIGIDGSSALRPLVAAGGGRVTGAHFGTYDYTALCGITASWQHMRHQACDFAKHMMKVSLAQSGVMLSDGSTNVLPIGPHQKKDGLSLTEPQRRANREAIHRAWKQHADDVTHSLVNGFYQGWDLHPAQLPSRFAAVFAFYASSRAAATARMRTFIDKVSQAAGVGDVFDDAATGQALLNFFSRGLSCGAITLDEALETGLTKAELQSTSFLKIVESRK